MEQGPGSILSLTSCMPWYVLYWIIYRRDGTFKIKINMHADRKLPKCPGTDLKRDVRQNWISIANLGKFGSVSSWARHYKSALKAHPVDSPHHLHRNKAELHVIFFCVHLKYRRKNKANSEGKNNLLDALSLSYTCSNQISPCHELLLFPQCFLCLPV